MHANADNLCSPPIPGATRSGKPGTHEHCRLSLWAPDLRYAQSGDGCGTLDAILPAPSAATFEPRLEQMLTRQGDTDDRHSNDRCSEQFAGPWQIPPHKRCSVKTAADFFKPAPKALPARLASWPFKRPARHNNNPLAASSYSPPNSPAVSGALGGGFLPSRS